MLIGGVPCDITFICGKLTVMLCVTSTFPDGIQLELGFSVISTVMRYYLISGLKCLLVSGTLIAGNDVPADICICANDHQLIKL